MLVLVHAFLGLALSVLLPWSAAPPEPVDPVGTWPLRPTPEVVTGFDPPESTWGPGHRGVDLAGTPGRQVLTALDGTVTFVGSIAGKAVVVVGHGPTRTTYEPVVSTLSPGDPVAEGQPIGQLVLPGSHCFPRACLHWGWLRGETYLDPLRLVGATPVRLLPLDGLPAAPYERWAPLTVTTGWTAWTRWADSLW